MQINKITISNILGIDELEIEPGKFTQISGRNGSGKTSVLEAIKAILKGGNDATLLRNGAEKGEIVLVLDEGYQLRKTVTGTKSDLNIYDERGREVKKPQSFLNDLIDMLSVNPISFLTADKKTRTAAFLEVMPLELPEEKLTEILDSIKDTFKISTFPNANALETINNIKDQIFEERTAINRSAKEKNASINQLQETLVEIDFSPEEVEVKLNALEAKKKDFYDKKESYLYQINCQKDEELEKLRIEFENAKEKIAAETAKQAHEVSDKFAMSYEPLIAEIASLREQQKQSGAVLKTKELIKQYGEETKKLNEISGTFTEALDKINDLKNGMLEKLPIQGLEIKDGEIFRNGVAFDRLNTAQQVEIAVEVAKLRAGKLGIICVDGIEKLDSETFNHFKDQACSDGLQMIVTKVTDGEFNITIN